MKCVWNYDVENKDCPLCHQTLMHPPQNNLNERVIRNDIAIGECNHGIHSTCISSWLKSNASCPLCMTSWAQAKYVQPSVYILKLDEPDDNILTCLKNKNIGFDPLSKDSDPVESVNDQDQSDSDDL